MLSQSAALSSCSSSSRKLSRSWVHSGFTPDRTKPFAFQWIISTSTCTTVHVTPEPTIQDTLVAGYSHASTGAAQPVLALPTKHTTERHQTSFHVSAHSRGSTSSSHAPTHPRGRISSPARTSTPTSTSTPTITSDATASQPPALSALSAPAAHLCIDTTVPSHLLLRQHNSSTHSHHNDLHTLPGVHKDLRHCKTPLDLQAVIQEHKEQLGLQERVTALCALAAFTKQQVPVRRSQHTSDLAAAAFSAAESHSRVTQATGGDNGRSHATCASHHAASHNGNHLYVDQNRNGTHINNVSSSTSVDPQQFRTVVNFLVDSILQDCSQATPAMLSAMCCALVNLRFYERSIVTSLQAAALDHVDDMTPHQLAGLTWSIAWNHKHHQHPVNELLLQRCVDCSLHLLQTGEPTSSSSTDSLEEASNHETSTTRSNSNGAAYDRAASSHGTSTSSWSVTNGANGSGSSSHSTLPNNLQGSDSNCSTERVAGSMPSSWLSSSRANSRRNGWSGSQCAASGVNTGFHDMRDELWGSGSSGTVGNGSTHRDLRGSGESGMLPDGMMNSDLRGSGHPSTSGDWISHPHSQRVSPQFLSRMLYSLAVLHHTPDAHWVSHFLRSCQLCMHDCRPQDISNLIWGVAHLQLKPSQAWMQQAESCVSLCLHSMDRLALTCTLCGWATMRYTPWPSTLKQCLRTSQKMVDHMSGQELATVVWALAALQAPVSHGWLHSFKRAVKRMVEGKSEQGGRQPRTLSPQAFANILWAFVRLRHRPNNKWLGALCAHVAPEMHAFTPHTFAITVWSLARLRYRPNDEWMCDFIRASHVQLQEFDHEDFTQVFWAMARLVARHNLRVDTHWYASLLDACHAHIHRLSAQELAAIVVVLSWTYNLVPEKHPAFVCACVQLLLEREQQASTRALVNALRALSRFWCKKRHRHWVDSKTEMVDAMFTVCCSRLHSMQVVDLLQLVTAAGWLRQGTPPSWLRDHEKHLVQHLDQLGAVDLLKLQRAYSNLRYVPGSQELQDKIGAAVQSRQKLDSRPKPSKVSLTSKRKHSQQKRTVQGRTAVLRSAHAEAVSSPVEAAVVYATDETNAR